VIVFGDVHLGSPHSRVEELKKCLASLGPERAVITGDLFEDQYKPVGREEAIRLIAKAMDVLGLRPAQLYIAFSSSSHDPQLPGPLWENINGVEVYAFNGDIFIEDVEVVVTHGDSVIKSGVLAYLVERVDRGRIGRVLRRRLGLRDEMWIAYGHSHVPHVDLSQRILNPGPWKIYGFRRIRGGVYELPSAKRLC